VAGDVDVTTSSTDSGVLNDIAQLTRMPARATLMVLAASIAVQRTSDRADGWRSWVDHALLIVLIAAITWLVAGLVMVAERRMIATYVGGDGDLTDADRRWRRIRTQVTVLRRLAIAIVVVVGIAAILMTFPSFSDVGTTLFGRPACSPWWPVWPHRRRWARCSPACRSPSPARSAWVTWSNSRKAAGGGASRRSR